MRKTVWQENVTIITGASFGIGRELALQLAEGGAWLALAARSADKLTDVVTQCEARGGRAIAVPTDVAVQSDCQALIEQTVKTYGRIDTLINNAGVGMDARFAELTDLKVFEKVMQINFYGSLYCTFYALPYLKQTRGRLVGVSSQRGLFPSARADAYGPSKFAMGGFFDSLRLELAGTGISVTMIYPEWVSSGITSRSLKTDGTPTGRISSHEKNGMPVDTCARMIIRAVEKRQRRDVMTWLGKLGLITNPIVPGIVEIFLRMKTG